MKAWQLHVILMIATIPGNNFGYGLKWQWLIIPLLPYRAYFRLIKFNDGNRLLLHWNFIPLCLTSLFLWKFYKRDWYLNSYYLFLVFLLPLITFNLYFLSRMGRHFYANLMETYFYTMGSIALFYVSLLTNLPIISIFSFK